jgi:general stress protein YciG
MGMARQKQVNESTSSEDQHRENESEQGSKRRESSGRGWHGDPQGHADAGSKGGRSVSQNREHMASIGRKGGQAVSRDRRHMAEIGRKGGQARGESSNAAQNEKSGQNK